MDLNLHDGRFQHYPYNVLPNCLKHINANFKILKTSTMELGFHLWFLTCIWTMLCIWTYDGLCDLGDLYMLSMMDCFLCRVVCSTLRCNVYAELHEMCGLHMSFFNCRFFLNKIIIGYLWVYFSRYTRQRGHMADLVPLRRLCRV